MAKAKAASIGTELGRGVGIGALTGIVAWSCCISAVVLSFLGLSTAAAFFSNVQMHYHWYLVGLAFIFMDVSIYYYIKQYHGACNFKTISHNSTPVIVVVLMALLGYFLLQAVLPTFEMMSGLSSTMMM